MDDPRNGGDLIHMPSAHLRTFKALLDSMRADSISNPDDILRSVGLSEIGLEELHRRMRAETGEEIRVQLGLAASLLAFDLAIAGRDTHLLIRSIYTFANYCNSAARLRLNRLQPLKASAYAQVAKILFGVLNNPRFGPSMDYASRIEETARSLTAKTRLTDKPDRLVDIVQPLASWKVSQKDFQEETSRKPPHVSPVAERSQELGVIDLLGLIGFEPTGWRSGDDPRPLQVRQVSFPWSELKSDEPSPARTPDQFVRALDDAADALRKGDFASAGPRFLGLARSIEEYGPKPGPAGPSAYMLLAYAVCRAHLEYTSGSPEEAMHLFLEVWSQSRRTPAFLRFIGQSPDELAANCVRACLKLFDCASGESAALSLSDLINKSLESLDFSCRSGAIAALIRLLVAQPDSLDDLGLSERARVALKIGIMDKLRDHRLSDQMPLHKMISSLALDFGRFKRTLVDAAKALASDPSMPNLTRTRPKGIEAIKRLQPFSTPEEARTLQQTASLLSESLTGYTRDQALRSLNGIVEQIQKATERSSSLRSRLLDEGVLPLLRTIRSALEADFSKRMESQRTTVLVSTDKQEYPLSPEGKQVDVLIRIVNNGNSAAANCRLLISPSDSNREDVAVLDEPFRFGDLPVGGIPTSRALRLRVLRPAETVALDYLAVWTSPSGVEQEQLGVLKLLAQKRIAWPEVVENPYGLGSIKDPERLKDRGQQLTVLRGGVATMTSFFITGQKRVGKSSIALVFSSELSKMPDVLSVYTVLGEVLGSEPDPAWLVLELCEGVARSFMRKTGVQIDADLPSAEEVRANFSRAFSTFLRTFRERHSSYRVYFIIDEFDELPESLYEGSVGDRFFLTLRALIDREYVGFVFVGSEKLPFILAKQGEKLNQVRPVRVDYLSRPDLGDLVRDPSSSILHFEEEAVSAVYEASAGNPYYATAICQQLWSEMVAKQDYFVSRLDAENLIIRVAAEDQISSYSHFWTDGIKAQSPEGAKRIENENAAVLVAVAHSSDAADFAAEGEIVRRARDILKDMSEKAVLERLDELCERQVLTRGGGGTAYRSKVPLFGAWLRAEGAAKIANLYKQPAFHVMRADVVEPRQLIEICRDLWYRGERVNEVQARAWLEQFGSQRRQWLAFKLLKALRERGYFGENFVGHACRQLLHQVLGRSDEEEFGPVQTVKRRRLQNVLVSHVDRLGKSGGALLTLFRRANQISPANVGSVDDIISRLATLEVPRIVIFVDNFVGTGSAASEDLGNALRKLDTSVPGWRDNTTVVYAVVAGYEAGEEAVAMSTKFDVRTVIYRQFSERDKAFHSGAAIFENDDERNEALDMSSEIGKQLEPKHPLGWSDSQALIVFHDNVPNNTLPIFCKRGRRLQSQEWIPLFPRD